MTTPRNGNRFWLGVLKGLVVVAVFAVAASLYTVRGDVGENEKAIENNAKDIERHEREIKELRGLATDVAVIRAWVEDRKKEKK